MVLLSGIDFPYWETFNLQILFPKLADWLSVFPSSQIYNAILRGWPELKDQIGPHLFAPADLKRKIETLYGSYLLALKNGATPYRLADRNVKFPTASFMVQQTGIRRDVVVAFLTTLEKLARAGTINQQYWDPDRSVAQNKEVTKRQKEAEATAPKGAVDKAVQAAQWVGVAALGITGLGLAAYLVPYFKRRK